MLLALLVLSPGKETELQVVRSCSRVDRFLAVALEVAYIFGVDPVSVLAQDPSWWQLLMRCPVESVEL